jgi:hypothetical protein
MQASTCAGRVAAARGVGAERHEHPHDAPALLAGAAGQDAPALDVRRMAADLLAL